MIETRFTQLVGATVPIQVASMPGVSTIELVAAVANAGAVGMLGASMFSAEQLDAELARVATATSGVFGVNFLMPFLDPKCVAVAARRARIVEFFYGEPQRALVDEAHAQGALVSWQVGSQREAIAAESAGCDFVVAQGTEAGGHVRGQTSLLPLLSSVLDTLRIPVVAAGGIATARDLAAVLACGASGARIGTRFVACAESGAHPLYVQALIAASAADTCLTEAFSEQWPDAPHRVLRSAVAAANASREAIVGEIEFGGARLPIPRFSPVVPTARTSGNIAAMALYAGESVTHVRSVQPAAAIIAELVAGAEKDRR
jgi:NAD(P)H-dependent flavin oxidoreductase YrpB (nitropropane dioxygenase family)